MKSARRFQHSAPPGSVPRPGSEAAIRSPLPENLAKITELHIARKLSQLLGGDEKAIVTFPDRDADLAQVASIKAFLAKLIRERRKISNQHGRNLMEPELR
ncbi:MAG: hypothetical protein NT090_11590 [Acidobacteria bacterium]|nr:hypothetical protein [Acidobacteriota bacterium]